MSSGAILRLQMRMGIHYTCLQYSYKYIKIVVFLTEYMLLPKMSISKFIHRFLSNPADRHTDNQPDKPRDRDDNTGGGGDIINNQCVLTNSCRDRAKLAFKVTNSAHTELTQTTFVQTSNLITSATAKSYTIQNFNIQRREFVQ